MRRVRSRIWMSRANPLVTKPTERPVSGSPQVTCPLLWDSPEGTRLVVTTAAENMSAEKLTEYPLAGAMFVSEPVDQPES